MTVLFDSGFFWVCSFLSEDWVKWNKPSDFQKDSQTKKFMFIQRYSYMYLFIIFPGNDHVDHLASGKVGHTPVFAIGILVFHSPDIWLVFEVPVVGIHDILYIVVQTGQCSWMRVGSALTANAASSSSQSACGLRATIPWTRKHGCMLSTQLSWRSRYVVQWCARSCLCQPGFYFCPVVRIYPGRRGQFYSFRCFGSSKGRP